MRIHVLQLAYGDDESVAARRERVVEWVRAQHGADLVVLPELWAPGGFAYQGWNDLAEPIDGPTITALAQAARHLGTVVHAGSIVESVPADRPRAERGPTGRGRWNTSVLLGPTGERLAVYRKIHRFGFGQGEPALLEAGDTVVSARLPDGTLVGLATCYDLRFPELFRDLVDTEARLVIVPAAWPAARIEAWSLLGRARAIENQFVVVQCNTAGTHSGVELGGRSQVVDAQGRVLAEAGSGEETLVVEVDLREVEDWRTRFPVLADRRPTPR